MMSKKVYVPSFNFKKNKRTNRKYERYNWICSLFIQDNIPVCDERKGLAGKVKQNLSMKINCNLSPPN